MEEDAANWDEVYWYGDESKCIKNSFILSYKTIAWIYFEKLFNIKL